MSKIATVLIGGGGTAAVAVGGTLLFRNGFGQVETPEVSLLFDSVGAFEAGWKTEKSKCVHNFFDGGFAESDNRTDATALSTVTDRTFFDTTTQTPYKSCVIIDWKKENYTGDKWTGKFTWTWSFVKGDKGFVNFNVAETISESNNKLKFTGVFYLVEKDASSGKKWQVKNKKEVKDDTTPKKEIEVAQIDSYFPKKGTGIKEAELADSYWGFFKNSTSGQQLQNICGTNDCTDANKQPTSSKRIDLSWKGIASPDSQTDTITLKDWNVDLNWWDNIYGATPWSLKDKIANFKGTWTKQS